MHWPMFRRVEHQVRRMHEMMKRLNVDPGKLARSRPTKAIQQVSTRCHAVTLFLVLSGLDVLRSV